MKIQIKLSKSHRSISSHYPVFQYILDKYGRTTNRIAHVKVTERKLQLVLDNKYNIEFYCPIVGMIIAVVDVAKGPNYGAMKTIHGADINTQVDVDRFMQECFGIKDKV